MTNLIEIQNLSKTYGSGPSAVHALQGIDLEVRGGEILIMAGPSGSGKTTLLSVMGGILQATSGSVKIAGREIVGMKENRLPALRLAHIGFIFQGFNLFPALTAVENVAIGLQLRATRKSEAYKKAALLLGQVGLSDKLRTLPANLSGGQKQRVAIARARAGQPPIILADEPTAALDSASGLNVMEMLTTLARREGRAVVIVTHDPRVLPYGDRVIHIADGRIVDDDSDGPVNYSVRLEEGVVA